MPFEKKLEPFEDGAVIRVPGQALVAPELSLAQLQRFQPRLAILQDASVENDAKLDLMFEVVHAALSRHYPEVTLEEVKTLLTMSNLVKAFTSAIKFRGDAGEMPAVVGTATAKPVL